MYLLISYYKGVTQLPRDGSVKPSNGTGVPMGVAVWTTSNKNDRRFRNHSTKAHEDCLFRVPQDWHTKNKYSGRSKILSLLCWMPDCWGSSNHIVITVGLIKDDLWFSSSLIAMSSGLSDFLAMKGLGGGTARMLATSSSTASSASLAGLLSTFHVSLGLTVVSLRQHNGRTSTSSWHRKSWLTTGWQIPCKQL